MSRVLRQSLQTLTTCRARGFSIWTKDSPALPVRQRTVYQLSSDRMLSVLATELRHVPGVNKTAIVSLPDAGAVVSNATVRVPRLGESHSFCGLLVSMTRQVGVAVRQ